MMIRLLDQHKEIFAAIVPDNTNFRFLLYIVALLPIAYYNPSKH
jgi:hypothetical protein